MSSRLGGHTGYLEIDHRDSPGIPPELAAQWAAQGVVVQSGSTRLEADVFTCAHCQAAVIKEPRSTIPRSVCRKCMKVTCKRCEMWCTPFEQIADQLTSAAYKVSQSGLLLRA